MQHSAIHIVIPDICVDKWSMAKDLSPQEYRCWGY